MAWPVSDDYLTAVKRGHRIATRVEILANGSTQAVLPIENGTVEVDATQTVRRTANIPLVDVSGNLVPGVPEDLLHIAGNELRAWRGINFGDDRPGTPDGIAPVGCELVPLITGPLFENDSDDQGDGIRLSLQIYDRSRWVADNDWDDTYAPTAGTLYTTAIMNGLLDRLPATLTVRTDQVDATDLNTPNGLGAGNNSNDPMQTFVKWARAIGMDLGFDPLGDPFIRDVPDRTADTPDADYSTHRHEVFTFGKKLSRERTYNRIIVTGESPGGTSAPVRAIAVDDDPSSPTYVDGKFGVRTFKYQSSFIRTQNQANRAAAAFLRRKQGLAEEINFGVLVDGRLDAYDVLHLRHDRMKVNGRYLLDAVTIPLDPETLAAGVVRRRKVY